mmetsp:Transcript_60851/g.162787  ORF Transcript_60851/g.162787 Transcript_60851/m.162787 type:complete len:142 (-) Transcript_60851:647-1072(-)
MIRRPVTRSFASGARRPLTRGFFSCTPQGAPAGAGGLQVHVPAAELGDGVVRAQLLLPLRQRGRHPAARRRLGGGTGSVFFLDVGGTGSVFFLDVVVPLWVMAVWMLVLAVLARLAVRGDGVGGGVRLRFQILPALSNCCC